MRRLRSHCLWVAAFGRRKYAQESLSRVLIKRASVRFDRQQLNCRAPQMTRRADFVEEVGEQFEMNRPGHSKDADCEPLMVSGWLRAWHRYQLGQLSEVLGGCCEKELITRTIRPS